MPRIHAVSDCHGHAFELARAIDMVDLAANPRDELVFLGDYIDRGPDSAACLALVKETEQRYHGRVHVLLGNHETDFLDWLDGGEDAFDWLLADEGLVTVGSFLGAEQVRSLQGQLSGIRDAFEVARINGDIQRSIRAGNRELLAWLRSRPRYHESAEHIFVHAGIDEEAGEDWKAYTPDYVFVQKYPAQFGSFHKVIVAGHVATRSMHESQSHAPYFDGQSHWYIDGSVEGGGQLNVLTYDRDTGAYSHVAVVAGLAADEV